MDDDITYIVLVNDEEQHSLWPTLADKPEGWTQVGPTGSKETCQAYVEEHWTDMTPKSARIGG